MSIESPFHINNKTHRTIHQNKIVMNVCAQCKYLLPKARALAITGSHPTKLRFCHSSSLRMKALPSLL